LLNETAVKVMGLKNPLGQIINNPYDKINWRVVGVVKNYVEGSPYEKFLPLSFWVLATHGLVQCIIKFKPNYSTADALAKADWCLKDIIRLIPSITNLLMQEYAKKFDDEQRTKTMAGLFAFLPFLFHAWVCLVCLLMWLKAG
jgi:hypothetical protein